ncbi:Uncharacterised protein [Neisseria animalis]|nr:Uncharacterised protein [Neisseria animalis]
MIQRCFALPYYVYCLRLRSLVSFLFYSTIKRIKLCSGLDFLRHRPKLPSTYRYNGNRQSNTAPVPVSFACVHLPHTLNCHNIDT